MLIINDFFKRNKEAVSNQMEYLLKKNGGKIVSATRFMNQKSFRKEDRKDKIFIYPPFLYYFLLFFYIIFSKDDIHIFEEEPSLYKRIICNISGKKIYVSMYREPYLKYTQHLKKYNKLSGVFVEDDYHKQKLVEYGISEFLIHVSYTPAKLPRKQNNKTINLSHVNLLFASWNNAEGDPLKERGLIYLLDLLTINPNFYLTVILRDNKTKQFIEEIKKRKLINKVKLLNVTEDELVQEFDNCDFVVYPIQKKLTKDIPNSLIDGISRGKPVILSTIFGFSRVVQEQKIGYIIEPNTMPQKFVFQEDEYYNMSKQAFLISKKYTKDLYVDNIVKNYVIWRSDDENSNY